MVPVNPGFFLKITRTGIMITKKGWDLQGPGSRSVTSVYSKVQLLAAEILSLSSYPDPYGLSDYVAIVTLCILF